MTPAVAQRVTDQLRTVPRMTFQQIADREGLSVGTISALAKAAGLTRGKGGAGTHARPRGRPSEFGEQIEAMRLADLPMSEILAETKFSRQGVDSACTTFLRKTVQALAQDHGLSVVPTRAGLIVNGHRIEFAPARMAVRVLSTVVDGPMISIQDQDQLLTVLRT